MAAFPSSWNSCSPNHTSATPPIQPTGLIARYSPDTYLRLPFEKRLDTKRPDPQRESPEIKSFGVSSISNATQCSRATFVLVYSPVFQEAAEKVEETQVFKAQSHQRSWWFVHTRPTRDDGQASRIPPTQLVDRSYSAYTGRWAGFPNPTNAVGGSFILGLHGTMGRHPESHQRSWWIVDTRPTRDDGQASRIPPTQLVDR